jgi:putative transposase
VIEELTSAGTPSYEVREVCATLNIAPSSFYAHRHKEERPRRREDHILGEAIKQSFAESGHSYGSPRLVKALKKQGFATSKIRPKGTRCGG